LWDKRHADVKRFTPALLAAIIISSPIVAYAASRAGLNQPAASATGFSVLLAGVALVVIFGKTSKRAEGGLGS